MGLLFALEGICITKLASAQARGDHLIPTLGVGGSALVEDPKYDDIGVDVEETSKDLFETKSITSLDLNHITQIVLKRSQSHHSTSITSLRYWGDGVSEKSGRAGWPG